MSLERIKEDVCQKGNQKLIAENITALLKQNNLNANQLSLALGIPMMTIRRIMSGETEDPRISTLKIIAEYFNVSIDLLIGDDQKSVLTPAKKTKSIIVPKITWEDLSDFNINNMNQKDWSAWQALSLKENNSISKNTFALESRPSMYPRFPKGTIFIIDPQTKPTDGDIVLIRLKENNEFTLRELIIDLPNWRLSPLVIDSDTINFDIKYHEIVGVSLITMLYNSKLGGN